MNTNLLIYLAATSQQYGCGAYGSSAYNQNQCATQTSGSSSTPGGGFLASTGYDIIIPVALGAALLIASLILLVKKLRRQRQ